MRLWVFDRAGAIGSEKFDINKNPRLFIECLIAFHCMNDERLGFDPTIKMSENQDQYIEIQKNGVREKIILDHLIVHSQDLVGRGTACWKAHSENCPSQPLVVKDSWHWVENQEEGELLKLALDSGVDNVARYYHHETVEVEDATMWKLMSGMS